ncbi:MAG TPA: phosphotransferase [Anaerolineales bacterium]|nr:phosphotransferase [Anaerolineales bacterium]
MNRDDFLSGNAGLAGIHWTLNGQSSRRLLRSEVQGMLLPGYRVGPFHLTRAKFKPGRKLSAYFSFPVLDARGKAVHLAHLAVAWQNSLDGGNDERHHLQDEANRAGLMPVQRELWKDLPDRGIRLQIWPLDPKFPHLVQLGNPSHVAGVFASLGIADDLKQLPVITPVRYRPGERHVLRYEISSPGTKLEQGQRLYAKLYKDGQDAARAFGVANRVVDWLDANNQGLQGNRPEAMSEEDCVIFYPHAPGVPLSQQLDRSPQWLAAQLKIIGRALVTLHNGPESLQAGLKENTFTNEARVVRRASEHIQVLLPETHDKILKNLDELQARYSDLPQEKPTFTHSDFKADHLLSTPQGLTLIDLDTCTLTDPALDLGKFLADLEWWFTLKGISGVEEAQAELLRGYLGEANGNPILHERLARARLFHVLILMKIVIRRVPLYKKEWGAMTARMIERAAHALHKIIDI